MSYALRSSRLTRPFPRVRMQTGNPFFLLPGGQRVRGSNVCPEPDAGDWHFLWEEWPWESWIKFQIDLLQSIGGNTVRMFGTYKAIYDDTLDEATYHSQWREVADYVADEGLYLYPCIGGDFGGGYGYTPPTSFVVDQAGQVAELLRDYPNIIGIDMVQERRSWAVTDGLAVRQAVRGEIDVPLTFSYAVADNTELANQTWRNEISALVDFFDLHMNNYTLGATDLANSYWAQEGKPLLIGEFGRAVSAGTTVRAAQYTAIKNGVNASATRLGSTVRVAGALSWSISDQDTVNTNKWGMFDAAGVARTEVTDVFQTFP